MKKNNVIVFAIAVAVSIFLLGLWYYLGFNKVDSPLDLVVTIVWWAVTAGLIAGIVQLERTRCQRIRTVYVAPSALYNPERGQVSCSDPSQRMESIQGILSGLDYGFERAQEPADPSMFQYVVRTDKYASDGSDWHGTVVHVDRASGNKSVHFTSRAELASALA